MEMQKEKPKLAPGLAPPEKMYLKAERIQEQLQRLPKWSLRPDGSGIERVRQVDEPAKAKQFVSYVCRLSSLRRQPVTIDVGRKQVVVTLKGHPARGCTGGLTDAVFDLAALIG